MAINIALNRTDWSLLAEQKLALVEALSVLADSDQQNLLEGLLNWIDAVQDAAESEGFPVVFLTTDDKAA